MAKVHYPDTSLVIPIDPKHIACGVRACSKACIISQAELDLPGIVVTDTNYTRSRLTDVKGDVFYYGVSPEIVRWLKHFDRTGEWLGGDSVTLPPLRKALRPTAIRCGATRKRRTRTIMAAAKTLHFGPKTEVSSTVIAKLAKVTGFGERVIKQALTPKGITSPTLDPTPVGGYKADNDRNAPSTRKMILAGLKGQALSEKIDSGAGFNPAQFASAAAV